MLDMLHVPSLGDHLDVGKTTRINSLPEKNNSEYKTHSDLAKGYVHTALLSNGVKLTQISTDHVSWSTSWLWD